MLVSPDFQVILKFAIITNNAVIKTDRRNTNGDSKANASPISIFTKILGNYYFLGLKNKQSINTFITVSSQSLL